jgi:hypothetical protein
LEDTTIVKDWGVKWNELDIIYTTKENYILYVGKEPKKNEEYGRGDEDDLTQVIKVDMESEVDYKYPEDEEIVDASDYGFEYEEDNADEQKVEEKVKEKVEEKEEEKVEEKKFPVELPAQASLLLENVRNFVIDQMLFLDKQREEVEVEVEEDEEEEKSGPVTFKVLHIVFPSDNDYGEPDPTMPELVKGRLWVANDEEHLWDVISDETGWLCEGVCERVI